MSKIPDIVERLRGCTDKKYPGFQNLNTEAADTITQLRLSNERLRNVLLAVAGFHAPGSVPRRAIELTITAESGTEVEP